MAVLVLAANLAGGGACRSLIAALAGPGLVPSDSLRSYPDVASMITVIGSVLLERNIAAGVVFDCLRHRFPDGSFGHPLGYWGVGFALLALALLGGLAVVRARLGLRCANSPWLCAATTMAAVLVPGIGFVLSDAQGTLELAVPQYAWFAEYAVLFGFFDLVLLSSAATREPDRERGSSSKAGGVNRTRGEQSTPVLSVLVFEVGLGTTMVLGFGVTAVVALAASSHAINRDWVMLMYGAILAYALVGLAALYASAWQRMRDLATVALRSRG